MPRQKTVPLRAPSPDKENVCVNAVASTNAPPSVSKVLPNLIEMCRTLTPEKPNNMIPSSPAPQSAFAEPQPVTPQQRHAPTILPSPMTQVMKTRTQLHSIPRRNSSVVSSSLLMDNDDDVLLGEEQDYTNGKRLLGYNIAIHNNITDRFPLYQLVKREKGFLCALETIEKPANLVVLPNEMTFETFLTHNRDKWWLRPAVFVSERQFTHICDGKIPIPSARRAWQSVSLQNVGASMRRLSLDVEPLEKENDEPEIEISEKICTKRKERPPVTPKKDKIKPFFSFESSPARKKNKVSGSFKFTSFAELPATEIAYFDAEGKEVPTEPVVVDITGKKFVLLGKFVKSKQQVVDIITSKGGVIPKSSHLSAKVDYLLCGVSSRGTVTYQKAEQKGIKIISETELYAMINFSA